MLLKNTTLVAKFGQIPVFSKFALFLIAHIPFQGIWSAKKFTFLTCPVSCPGDLRGLKPLKKTSEKVVQNHTVHR